MKICFKCKTEKPLFEFYAHKKMADGYLNKCKDCTKKDVRDRRFGENREYILWYDRQRASIPKRKEKNKVNGMKYKLLFPERKSATTKLRSALKKGLIKPLPCFVCGENAEAHHPDYSRPLDVMWLCPSHHKQTHALAKE